MSRFTTITLNTGLVASASDYDFSGALTGSKVNIAKVKVTPSASTIGWYLELYKRSTRLSADLMYSTRNPVVGSYYDPTDRNGNEVLEGWVLPYENLDAALLVEGRIHNSDPVSRSYDIEIHYEDPLAALASAFTVEDLSSQVGTAITLGATPAGTFFMLIREGVFQTVGAGNDYTRVTTAITLALTKGAAERMQAVYVSL